MPPSRSSARSVALAALAVAALLTGCGGGDDSGSDTVATTPPGISKDEFISRGDLLCRRYVNANAPLARRLFESKDHREQARLMRRIADGFDRAVAGFDAMPRPKGSEVLNPWLARVRANATLLRRAADEFERGNVEEGTNLFADANAANVRVQPIPRTYGFQVCGG